MNLFVQPSVVKRKTRTLLNESLGKGSKIKAQRRWKGDGRRR